MSRKTRIFIAISGVFVVSMCAWGTWEFPPMGGPILVMLTLGLMAQPLTVWKLDITPDALMLSFLFRRRSVSRAEIEEVLIETTTENDRKYVMISLLLIDQRRPISFLGLGVEPLELYQRLTDWQKQRATETPAAKPALKN